MDSVNYTAFEIQLSLGLSNKILIRFCKNYMNVYTSSALLEM